MTDGIWGGEAIATTVAKVGLTPGVGAELPDWSRFLRRTRELLQVRTKAHGSLSAPCVFVMTQDVSADLAEAATLHRRLHTGAVDPSGKLWLVGAAVSSGRAVDLPGNTMEETFSFVCEQIELQTAPTILCDTTVDPQLFAYYPMGLESEDVLFEGEITEHGVPPLGELIDVVERVHKLRLLTSYNQNSDTSLWEDRDKHHAHQRAEKRVQDALMAGLGGAFPSPFYVDQELTGHTGRYDISFREHTAYGTTKLHAVIELKIARSYGSKGAHQTDADNQQIAVDGVTQVRAYADEHEATDAACLVFDLRTPEEHNALLLASQRADALNVMLRAWRCFPSALHYRKFVVPA
jgi:hypothetical protein